MLAQLFPERVFEERDEGDNIYTIAVSIYEANHVSWFNLQTRVCVQLGKTKKCTKVKESSDRPFYNESFTFNFDGKLERMMDMILTITVQEYRSGIHRHKTLGSARLDLGAIWIQPGHEISDKWILLTHPSDPAGHIRGYINCEISIMPQGEKPRLRRFHEPSGYFIPENLGGGKLKARYTFRIHRGTNIYIPDIKGFAVYVRVFFAGLSGETTKRKETRFPHWTEEIVFTELFPPMYNRIRIDVHFGKKEICTKYLNLSRISDPAVKGFLPTYGPSFLHLYNPPYRYLGALLVSLETKTVHAFNESEKLLGVKRQKTQEIIEKMFWEYEDFALFGVIYEVSMLRIPSVTESDVQIVLGFSTSEERPYNEGNQYHSWRNNLVQMDLSYCCIPKTEEKSTVFTTEKLPDNRHRVFVSNRLFHISQKLGEDLAQIHFELDHSPEKARITLLESLQHTIQKCQQFKSTAVPGPTSLEKERLKTVIAKVNKIIKEMTKIKPDGIVTAMFEKSLEICHDLFNLAKDPQESFPQIILIVKSNEEILAYSQINPSTVLFSSKENEKGIKCGVVQSLFLKGVNNRKLEETFGGKMDILLWLGPVKSIGYGIESIPSGFQDLTHELSFPSSIKYSQVHDFTCRAHLYQGHFLPCDDHSGSCSLVMTVYFDCKSASSSIKEYLSPLWLETLVIRNAKLFGNIQDIKKNPPCLVIEMWNIGKPSILLGRHLVTPHVFLENDRLQPPAYPPKPDWLTIHSDGIVKGEILTMFEIIQVRGESDRGGEETEVTQIPDYIRLPTDRYKLEILFWGVRRSTSLSLHDLNVPSVTINCGHIRVTSNQLRNPSSFPNFSQPLFIFDLDLPEDWHYAPPVVIRLFDNRMFGTQVFVGSHIVRNLKQFLVELPSKDELGESRRTRALTVSGSFTFSEAYARKQQQLAELRSDFESKTPLIYLKEDVKSKTPLMRNLEEKRSRWWTYICCCWRKKKEEPGYISLGLVCPFNDPDSDEEFYDWWTKYFDSLPRHMYSDTKDENISPIVREANLKVDFELGWLARKTPGIKIYPNELENQPEFEGFEDIIRTFTLTKDLHKRSKDCGKFKGCLALYKETRGLMTLDGFSVEEGMYSSVERELGAVVPLTVRVYVIRAHQLHSNEKMKKVNAFIEVTVPSRNHVISDSKNFIRQECNPIFGKYYELEVRLPNDSTLAVRVMDKKRIKDKELIGETFIDIENRYYSRHRGTCGLQRAYATEGYNTWRDVRKPSEILDWTCMSHNLPLPIYDIDRVIVGGLKFTSERRHDKDPKESLALKALLNWDKVPALGCKLVEEHVETRSLYIPQQPGVEKGKLEMWVDIFPGQIDLPPPVNVKPRTPERYELRAVVWSTRNVRLIDDGALVGKKNTDIYVKGWLKGKPDVQKTDVHYASLTGEGLFNWRFVFDFSYDRQEQMIVLDDFSNKIPPILHMQVWDQERIHYNQYIGSLSLDIRDVPPPSRRLPLTKSYVPIKGWNRNLFRDRYARGWWPFIGEDKGHMKTVGMVDLELILLTSMEAERSPAGRGRNDPDALPDPVRPIMQYTIWIVPFRAIKNYLWRYHKGAMLKVLLAIVTGFFIMVLFYSIPNYSVKKIMGAVCRNDRRKRWTKCAALVSFMKPSQLRGHEVELLVGNRDNAALNHVTVGDGKSPPIEGEVCLLTDSPFRILRAAESGNLEDFNRLFLAEPERLGVRDSKGRAAVHQAAAKNKLNILQFIANHGGDLNLPDHHGNTPLHIAVEYDSLEAVDFLFENGVDPNILNEKKQSVIHLATELNKVKVLKAVVKYKSKIDVNIRGEHGRTALHLAAIYDHDECARLLIKELGACPRKPCNNGYYPIHEAAKNASSRTMEVFLQWGEERGCSREEMISFYDSEGNVPLHSAVHSGDFKAIELCLKSGAKISTQQHDLSTPVHLACAQGALDIVKLMFRLQPEEKPICLQSSDVQKMTPLHCAAMFDRAEIVKYLIEEGADINALDKEKRSPLLLAGSRGGWRTVLTLIRLNANIQLKDSNDRNVLHLVVMNGGRLEEFADAVIKAQSRDKLNELLNEKDRTGCSPLHHASREGHIKSLENLIKLGAIINVKNNFNESPLHFAARYGRYNTVKQLLDSEKGSFIINETDGGGLTPLHIASQQGHTRVVALLLNRGALLHRDHNGRNPLHLAAMSGYTQTMELLHSVHSHLLDQVDKDGNTALHLATMENKPNSIALLLSLNCKLLYNNSDHSAIDYAIYYKFPEAALAMVTHDSRGQEVMALRSDKHPCVTLALIAAMPRVFESVQDKCITKANCKKDSKSYYIKYCFSCLECRKCPPAHHDSKVAGSFTQQLPIPLPALNIKYNFQNYQRSAKENAILQKFYGPTWKPDPLIVVNAMVQHGRVELLAHPLSQKYLEMKWNSYGKYFHMTHLLLYLIFLALVTIYSSHVMSKDISCKIFNGTNLNSTQIVLTERECRKRLDSTLEWLLALPICVYAVINIMREIAQLFQQRRQYLLDLTNLVSGLLYICTLLMIIPGLTDDIQVPCASITVFLSWFTLLLILRRFDFVGIYVVMFLEILQTLIKVLVVFSILIIAFGLAFYILLSRGGHVSFSSVPMSLMRTFSMMLGEIDFLGTYVHPLDWDMLQEGPRLPFPITAFIILGLFMVLMPILLMNLLIGLAVGDIESVRRNAQLKRLAMQVVLHTELERKMPHFLLEKVDKMEIIEYPNENKCKLGFIDHLFRMWFCNPFSEDGLEMVLENSEDVVTEEVAKIKRRLKELSKTLDSQGQLLKLIVQKMEIKTEADDVDEGVSPRELASVPGGGDSKWTSPRVRNKLRSALSFSKSHPMK